jgi:hypothetical protein
VSDQITPFRIAITDDQLEDLKRRLRATRWPERECVDDWTQGLPLAYAQDVASYWLEKYDWRAREASLNRFPQFKTLSGDVDLEKPKRKNISQRDHKNSQEYQAFAQHRQSSATGYRQAGYVCPQNSKLPPQRHTP